LYVTIGSYYESASLYTKHLTRQPTIAKTTFQLDPCLKTLLEWVQNISSPILHITSYIILGLVYMKIMLVQRWLKKFVPFFSARCIWVCSTHLLPLRFGIQVPNMRWCKTPKLCSSKILHQSRSNSIVPARHKEKKLFFPLQTS
jgi:hypothetical protein